MQRITDDVLDRLEREHPQGLTSAEILDTLASNGIKFSEYSSRALAKSLRKALALYAEPALLREYRQNGMRVDFSWDRTAGEFLRVYRHALDTD